MGVDTSTDRTSMSNLYQVLAVHGRTDARVRERLDRKPIGGQLLGKVSLGERDFGVGRVVAAATTLKGLRRSENGGRSSEQDKSESKHDEVGVSWRKEGSLD